jgi:hypothetical protein
MLSGGLHTIELAVQFIDFVKCVAMVVLGRPYYRCSACLTRVMGGRSAAFMPAPGVHQLGQPGAQLEG